MGKIKYVSELPNWFSLDNYHQLSNLSFNELEQQVALRKDLLNLDILAFKAEGRTTESSCFLNWTQLIEGHVLLSSESELINELRGISTIKGQEKQNKIESSRRLPASNSIKALAVGDISRMWSSVDGVINIEGKCVLGEPLLQTKSYDLVNKETLLCDDSSIHLQVDLSEPNEKLIDEFSQLLNQYRERLDIAQPNKLKNGYQSDVNKIKEYQLIPLIDLKIWEKITENKIAYDTLTMALFPYGDKSENQFKQTILQFFHKVTHPDYSIPKE